MRAVFPSQDALRIRAAPEGRAELGRELFFVEAAELKDRLLALLRGRREPRERAVGRWQPWGPLTQLQAPRRRHPQEETK